MTRTSPPDEQFWVKYSPQHEFPLSIAGSFLTHALGIGLIAVILGGLLHNVWSPAQRPELRPVQYAGSGDDGERPNAGGLPATPVEAGQLTPDPSPFGSPRKLDDAPVPQPVTPAVPTVELPPDAAGARHVQEADTAVILGRVEKIGRETQERIRKAAAGPVGVGPGPGGPPAKLVREKRQQRWVMSFNTRDGSDYLRQLQHLGAILAVPQPDGQFLVYRDLARRPAVGKIEDVSAIDRIFWVDDKPQSVQSLAGALGIDPAPAVIVAFFPEGLEKELRQKEARHYNGPEDNIEETRFQVVWRGTRFEPVVVAQRIKKPGAAR